MKNTFQTVAQKDFSLARTLALMVSRSHHVDELFACIRFHRAMTGQDLGGYLDGCYFADFQNESGELVALPEELRNQAWDYLDGSFEGCE